MSRMLTLGALSAGGLILIGTYSHQFTLMLMGDRLFQAPISESPQV